MVRALGISIWAANTFFLQYTCTYYAYRVVHTAVYTQPCHVMHSCVNKNVYVSWVKLVDGISN